MRSVGQRVSIQMPAGFDAATSFDDQPISINGRRVTPERGGQNLIYVPLTGLNSDEVVHRRTSGPKSLSLRLPAIRTRLVAKIRCLDR